MTMIVEAGSFARVGVSEVGGFVRRLAAKAESAVPPQPGLVAPIYHRIGGRSPSPVDLPLAVFEQQLAVIAAGAAKSWDDALAANSGIAVTFDDGTADWVDIVLPALERFGVPAMFYVATAFVDEQREFPDAGRPITWNGLRELASHPLVTIGSHTHRHRVLATVGAAEADDELRYSRQRVEDELGIECRHFAYPRAVLGSPAAEVVVRRTFESAALAGGGANPRAIDRYRVVRTPITVRDDRGAAARKIAGRTGRVEGRLRELRDARRARRDG